MMINLTTFALAAVASQLPDKKAGAPELLYLRDAQTALNGHGEHWSAGLSHYLGQPDPSDAPLIALGKELKFTTFELLSVALAASVENHLMAGRALARVQAPMGGSRPLLGLLATVFGETLAAESAPLAAFITGAAIQSGLIELLNDGAPLPERPASVPLPLCLALDGRDGAWPGATIGLGDIPTVPLPPSLIEKAHRHARGLEHSPQRALIIRTGSTAEGRSSAAEIAQAMQRRPAFIEGGKTTGLGPWLMMRELLPVFQFELAPGEQKALPSIACYHGPALVLCGPDGNVQVTGGAAMNWSLPVPPREERRALWRMAVGNIELADELASLHRHSSGRIALLGRLAQHRRSLNGHTYLTRADIATVAWSGEGAGLEGLAQPLPDPISDEALVLPPVLRAELETLVMRCRARDDLASGLGASAKARYCPGVRALFVGASGTGKTLAAGWLATRLGVPLYRVDLSAVTSKYIGETEKNLAQLLARAEQTEAVLLFDEADSMFGKRTDIKDSNDRFANAQTNYLLQRIETFDGITLLTSNSRTRFDESFSRRLDVIVDFPLPGPEERRTLWLAHLGENHGLTQAEINRIAVTADLGGGHIRNVVLLAAVLAQTANRHVAYVDVVRGLTDEYRKLGKQMPVELSQG